MNRFGKILNGKDKIKIAVSDMPGIYDQVSENECPEGYYPVERVLPYPTRTDDTEIAFIITKVDNVLKKEGFLIKRGTHFYNRKFSKLKIYSVLSSLGKWKDLKDWMESSTIEESGINIYEAYLMAQELAENHPLFSTYLNKAKEILDMTDDEVENILEQCIVES